MNINREVEEVAVPYSFRVRGAGVVEAGVVMRA
jgi:hypothetical protein